MERIKNVCMAGLDALVCLDSEAEAMHAMAYIYTEISEALELMRSMPQLPKSEREAVEILKEYNGEYMPPMAGSALFQAGRAGAKIESALSVLLDN